VGAHSKQRRDVEESDENPKKHNRMAPDAVKEYIDSNGRKLVLKAEFKLFNDRLDIAAITIQATDYRSPITRRMLSEIPLDRLFRDELAVETEHLNRILRTRKTTTAHRGRPHSDEELRTVAEIYISAFKARIPVQKAVADALGISVSTATKRIMAARRRGLITTNKGENQE
jgi:hypothetical protein